MNYAFGFSVTWSGKAPYRRFSNYINQASLAAWRFPSFFPIFPSWFALNPWLSDRASLSFINPSMNHAAGTHCSWKILSVVIILFLISPQTLFMRLENDSVDVEFNSRFAHVIIFRNLLSVLSLSHFVDIAVACFSTHLHFYSHLSKLAFAVSIPIMRSVSVGWNSISWTATSYRILFIHHSLNFRANGFEDSLPL